MFKFSFFNTSITILKTIKDILILKICIMYLYLYLYYWCNNIINYLKTLVFFFKVRKFICLTQYLIVNTFSIPALINTALLNKRTKQNINFIREVLGFLSIKVLQPVKCQQKSLRYYNLLICVDATKPSTKFGHSVN